MDISHPSLTTNQTHPKSLLSYDVKTYFEEIPCYFVMSKFKSMQNRNSENVLCEHSM
uniref:Uncharacterized protein n=1 Tax=Oryza brachyantha TaxID=4533 RepID=J3MTB0_ORYBR